jgi:hypothetical protein
LPALHIAAECCLGAAEACLGAAERCRKDAILSGVKLFNPGFAQIFCVSLRTKIRVHLSGSAVGNPKCRLFLEEIEEGLAVTIYHFRRSGSTSLLFNKNLGLEQGTHVIQALICDANLYGFGAFVASRRIEVQAIATGMQIGSAIPAFLGNTDLIHNLNFRCTIIAARNQVELGFDSPTRPSRTRRWFWPSFPVGILISGLTIFSRHYLPQTSAGSADKIRYNLPTL